MSNVLQLHVLSHVCLLLVSVKQGLSHTDLLICVYIVGGSRAGFDKYLLELCCEVSGRNTYKYIVLRKVNQCLRPKSQRFPILLGGGH